MQEAELMSLFRTLLIMIIVYYSVRFLVRLFTPFLIKKVVGNMQEKAKKKYTQQNQHSQKSFTREGETIIDKTPDSKSEGNNSVGEYVDFEEID
tara:strand:- start:33197 stop:33478 length:282 start_codon:yes stop_codon:yes gene_type:complete